MKADGQRGMFGIKRCTDKVDASLIAMCSAGESKCTGEYGEVYAGCALAWQDSV